MLTKDRLNNPWYCNYSFHHSTQCLSVFVRKILQVQVLTEFSKSPKTVLRPKKFVFHQLSPLLPLLFIMEGMRKLFCLSKDGFCCCFIINPNFLSQAIFLRHLDTFIFLFRTDQLSCIFPELIYTKVRALSDIFVLNKVKLKSQVFTGCAVIYTLHDDIYCFHNNVLTHIQL